MVFAFQCHASVLPIYSELKQPSKQKMQVTQKKTLRLKSPQLIPLEFETTSNRKHAHAKSGFGRPH